MLLTVFTRRIFIADFIQVKCIFDGKRPFWVFELGSLGATYVVHLSLIKKRLVDFLSVIIELFSLGVMADALRANIDCKSAFCRNGVSLAEYFKYKMSSFAFEN